MTQQAIQGMRVRLIVPDGMRGRHPAIHGEHLAYHGKAGEILCGAGAGGAWVRFDGQARHEYVGCPAAWLQREAEA